MTLKLQLKQWIKELKLILGNSNETLTERDVDELAIEINRAIKKLNKQ